MIRLPSGDQAGRLLAALSVVRAVTPEPSAFMTKILLLRSHAIFAALGDHAEWLSWTASLVT